MKGTGIGSHGDVVTEGCEEPSDSQPEKESADSTFTETDNPAHFLRHLRVRLSWTMVFPSRSVIAQTVEAQLLTMRQHIQGSALYRSQTSAFYVASDLNSWLTPSPFAEHIRIFCVVEYNARKDA